MIITERFDEYKLSLPVSELQGAIKLIRVKKGITQKELGEAINYPNTVISAIESGSRKLGLITLQRLAEALDVELKIEITIKEKTTKLPNWV